MLWDFLQALFLILVHFGLTTFKIIIIAPSLDKISQTFNMIKLVILVIKVVVKVEFEVKLMVIVSEGLFLLLHFLLVQF